MRIGDDAGAELRAAAAFERENREPLLHPRDRLDGALEVGFGKHDREFVSPVASEEVGEPQLAAEPRADLAAEPFAGLGRRVTIPARGGLDIEQDETETERVPAGALELLLQTAVETASLNGLGSLR